MSKLVRLTKKKQEQRKKFNALFDKVLNYVMAGDTIEQACNRAKINSRALLSKSTNSQKVQLHEAKTLNLCDQVMDYIKNKVDANRFKKEPVVKEIVFDPYKKINKTSDTFREKRNIGCLTCRPEIEKVYGNRDLDELLDDYFYFMNDLIYTAPCKINHTKSIL